MYNVRMRYGNRTRFVLTFALISALVGGVAWKVFQPQEPIEDGGVVGQHYIQKVRDELQLLITVDPEKEANLYMQMAEQRLNPLLQGDEISRTQVSGLVDEYIDAIQKAVQVTGNIDPIEEKNAVQLAVFRRLAYHQPLLRAVRRRPPESPVNALDRARYENMRQQEKLVHEMGNIDPNNSPSPNISKTTKQLECRGCNLILISLTTLRKDRIGLYGYTEPTTPNIDSFFRDSLYFTHTITPSSWTIPDAVSLFTSLFPYTHGLILRERASVPILYNKKIQTMAEILSSAGYKTAAFTGGGDYNRRYHELNRGFDFYLDETNYQDFGITDNVPLGGPSLLYSPLRAFLSLAVDWLNRNHTEPFFLFVQGYDTHCPLEAREPYAQGFTAGLKSAVDFSVCHWTYDTSEPIVEGGTQYWTTRVQDETRNTYDVKLSSGDVEYMNGLYDARVSEVDDRLSTLFDEIERHGLEKNTIIVLMSEHGEMLGESGWFMRGGALRGTARDEALSFPLIIRHPNVKEPVVIDDIVQLVDVMPSILSMLGINDPQQHLRDGTSVSFSAYGDTPRNEYGYAGTLYVPAANNKLFSQVNSSEVVRSREWKLVKETIFQNLSLVEKTITYKLYDLKNDSHERVNLYDREPEIARELKNRLSTWLEHYYMEK